VKKNGATASYSVYNKSGQLLLTDGPQGVTRYIYLGSQLIARIGNTAAAEDKPGYTGHLEDDDLSLTYMQQRYYDPVVGRFYSNDPVGFTASNPMMFNRYAYANNNPYKFVDPDGRNSKRKEEAFANLGIAIAEMAGLITPEQALGMRVGISNGKIKSKRGKKGKSVKGRKPSPTIDSATNQEVGRFVVDSRGNTMIEPVGGSTVWKPARNGSIDIHTVNPNGSNYQRLNPLGHPNNPKPHGHGHLQGTGPGIKGQGPSIDTEGNIVPRNSPEAHWPIIE
jgi:RHS repeat-associated protein